MIYVSEPFGFCSFYSRPFDDFEVLMPFMMNSEEGHYFDITKMPKIKAIKYIVDEEGKKLKGLRTTYIV